MHQPSKCQKVLVWLQHWCQTISFAPAFQVQRRKYLGTLELLLIDPEKSFSWLSLRFFPAALDLISCRNNDGTALAVNLPWACSLSSRNRVAHLQFFRWTLAYPILMHSPLRELHFWNSGESDTASRHPFVAAHPRVPSLRHNSLYLSPTNTFLQICKIIV